MAKKALLKTKAVKILLLNTKAFIIQTKLFFGAINVSILDSMQELPVEFKPPTLGA